MSTANHIIKSFTKGTYNKQDNEDIPTDAAQSSMNWVTNDDRIELVRGREYVGPGGTVGKDTGLHFGVKNDGSTVMFRKVGTTVQYFDESDQTWKNTITGLIEGLDMVFTNYVSLAGNFTFATGQDGMYKINVANPGNAINLTDEAKNFKGFGLIDRGRMILWGRKEDKTGLYGSWIDGQDSNNYTTVTGEVLGTGDGTTTIFNHTLAFKTANPLANAFGLVIFVPTSTTTTITGITKSASASVSVADETAFEVGDTVSFSGVVGMTEINGLNGIVMSKSAGTIVVNINSTGFTTYTSGGTLRKMIRLTDNFNGGTNEPGATTETNYTTGVIKLTTDIPVPTTQNIIVEYQWENSNNKGVTDFSYSEPRVASEGFMFRQDEGGDEILKVEIGQDGAYYSMKKFSSYRLELDTTDLNAVNTIFRKDIGIPSNRASVSTGSGIVFINTANPERPVLTILTRNSLGDSIEPKELVNHYDFSRFRYDDAALTTYGSWTVIACRTNQSTYNNRLILVDIGRKRVDTINYTARTFAKSRDQYLYAGDSVTESVQRIFSGYDDLDLQIENEWIGKGETYASEDLKKAKRLVLQGLIDTNQNISVFISEDDSEFYLAGTVRGDAEYVDTSREFTVGSSMVGDMEVGGDTPEEQFIAYKYFREIKIKTSKYRKITIKFVATGFGFCSVNYLMQKNILVFEQRIPKKYRVKQNENLAGTESDLPLPEFN